MLAWGGLRGAVPVILATFAVIEGVPRGIEMLNIVFFAVLLSAAVQGPTVHQLAARLRGREKSSGLRCAEMGASPTRTGCRSRASHGRSSDARLQLISCGGRMRAMREPPDMLRIVFGYDGSDSARRGLARVRQWPRNSWWCSSLPRNPRFAPPASAPDPTGHAIATGRLLEEARELLGRDEAVTVETRAAVGDPAAVLIETAHEFNAELLIVGRRGGRIRRPDAPLGSPAQRLVQNAPCDVLVVA